MAGIDLAAYYSPGGQNKWTLTDKNTGKVFDDVNEAFLGNWDDNQYTKVRKTAQPVQDQTPVYSAPNPTQKVPSPPETRPVNQYGGQQYNNPSWLANAAQANYQSYNPMRQQAAASINANSNSSQRAMMERLAQQGLTRGDTSGARMMGLEAARNNALAQNDSNYMTQAISQAIPAAQLGLAERQYLSGNDHWQQSFNANQAQQDIANNQWLQQFLANQTQQGVANNQWQQQFDTGNNQWTQSFNRQGTEADRANAINWANLTGQYTNANGAVNPTMAGMQLQAQIGQNNIANNQALLQTLLNSLYQQGIATGDYPVLTGTNTGDVITTLLQRMGGAS